MCALSFSVRMYVSVLSVHHTCIHTQSGREEEMGELGWGTEGERNQVLKSRVKRDPYSSTLTLSGLPPPMEIV